jgi:cadmium resistance protein CadD (predicted permease)
MLDRIAVAGLTVGSFVATSFDNFTLLLGFFSDPRYSRRRVLLGYVASTLGMVVLAYAFSAAVELAPAGVLGLLGIVPLAFGLQGLYRLWRPASSGGEEDGDVARERGFVAVLLVMLANSGDTFGVFVSLFADTAEGLEVWILVSGVGMAAAYAVLARWLVSHEGVAEAIRKIARVVLPFLLIAIGLYILADTGTDVVG